MEEFLKKYNTSEEGLSSSEVTKRQNQNGLNELKEKKNIDSLVEANKLFERVWKMYPNKKGKGQVSDAQKKRLLAIGEDRLVKAIERYSLELQKDAGWRNPQYGSTFFNSG